MIYIGTSGYSYDDWVGKFYASNIDKKDMLNIYSSKFKFTEINSTYYGMPNKYMFSNLDKKTPDDFKFTVKLHSSMTHTRDANASHYNTFCESIKPIIDSQKLGCIVAQFPYSFHYNDYNFDYVKKVKYHFENIPLSVEFRNNEWMKYAIYEKLKNENIGFICVDEPDIDGLIKKSAIVTSDIGYIRFHGRNKEKWYNHKEAYERYDYLYDENSLKGWIPQINFINKNSKTTFIAFNNHFRAQGAVNANMLQRLLSQ